MNLRLITPSLMLAALISNATPASPNVLDLKHEISDSSVIFPESFENDTQSLLESWFIKNYTASDDRYKTLPDNETSDLTIKKRLAALPTVIELPYNSIVRQYIDRYTKKGRDQVAAILGLSLYYMPIFEQALEEEQLPLELKYLPVIESGLDPNAVSRHGATGLWQFMLATARGVGMDVNSLVDERRDPYKSSKCAAKYLHDLYDLYGDWGLAIAAYNCGPGAVNKAIRRAGGDPKSHDFWSIYYYLTPETRGYLPMFIAANYVMNYYPEHNISPVVPTKPLVTDTVHVGRRIHFEQIATVLSIPIEELRILNPQFRADIIPGSAEHIYNLILPSRQALAYAMSEEQIAGYEAEKYTQRIEVEPATVSAEVARELAEEEIAGEAVTEFIAEENILQNDEPESEISDSQSDNSSNFSAPTRSVTHTVAAGETLADIASRYEVKVSDIRSWNALRRNAVRTGQKLRILTSVPAERLGQQDKGTEPRTAVNQPKATSPQSKSTAGNATSTKPKSNTQKTASTPTKPTSHKIKSGENLTTIARKYGVSVDALRKANGMSGDNIRAGQSLTIPTKSSSAKSSGSSSRSGKSSSSSKKRNGKRR